MSLIEDNIGEDVYLYEYDRDRYMTIYRWREDEIDQRRAEFMGEEFAETPKLTEYELFEKIKYRKNRMERLEELNAPQVLVMLEADQLAGLMNEVKRKNYIRTRAEEKYAKDYTAKQEEFQKGIMTHCADIFAERDKLADEFIAEFRKANQDDN